MFLNKGEKLMSEIYEYRGYKLRIKPSETKDMFIGTCTYPKLYLFHFEENLKRYFREIIDKKLEEEIVVTPMTEKEWDDIWNKLQAKLSKEENPNGRE